MPQCEILRSHVRKGIQKRIFALQEYTPILSVIFTQTAI
jgi:hypothetical protein